MNPTKAEGNSGNSLKYFIHSILFIACSSILILIISGSMNEVNNFFIFAVIPSLFVSIVYGITTKQKLLWYFYLVFFVFLVLEGIYYATIAEGEDGMGILWVIFDGGIALVSFLIANISVVILSKKTGLLK